MAEKGMNHIYIYIYMRLIPFSALQVYALPVDIFIVISAEVEQKQMMWCNCGSWGPTTPNF